MKTAYYDILSLTDKKPLWFDEQAVPRYLPFKPDMVNIYASEVCLFEIKCQGCGHIFIVALSYHHFFDKVKLSEAIEDNNLNYGDPPNIGCCDAGPTMTSDSIRVLEFWAKNVSYKWERKPQYEHELIL